VKLNLAIRPRRVLTEEVCHGGASGKVSPEWREKKFCLFVVRLVASLID